jgi:cytochrome b6-f complex iron-sulfur subunit
VQRRQFIRKSAITLAAITGLAAAAGYLRQFFPRRAGQKRRITLGEATLYPVDAFTFIEEHNLYLYRDHEGVRAVSAVCTHLGCILGHTTDGFECPCHGSCYNHEGEVLSGPAPRDLTWYQVNKTSEGKIIVDPSIQVDPGTKFLTS